MTPEPPSLLPVQAARDAEQRARAVHDVHRSQAVEASAGAGKTTLLIDRFLRLLSTGAARIEQVVAITFTEKAAGELQARLRDELARRSRLADDPERGFLEAALADLHRAQVSTIHAFCMRLLKMRPLEAGLDPGFRVLEPLEGRLLLEESWRDWLDAATSEDDVDLLRALRLGLRMDAWRDFASTMLDHRDLLDWMGTDGRESLEGPGGLLERARALAGRLAARLRDLASEARPFVRDWDDAGWRFLSQDGLALAGRLEEALRRDPASFDLEWSVLRARVEVRGNKANWRPPARLAELKRELKALKEELGDLQEELRHEVAGLVATRVRDFVAFHQRRKAERGVVDYTDLLVVTRDLLRHCPSARAYLQQRFRHLLVDEFQDTDPLQAEIVFFLAEDGARATSMEEVVLRPGALFVVGDPKQSIYRFRRADVELYREAVDRIARQGDDLALSLNFRSRPGIVRWVNTVFGEVFGDHAGGEAEARPWQAPYHPMEPTRPEGESDSPSVALLYPGEGEASCGVGEARGAEARAVADLIAWAEGRWRVSAGKGLDADRPARFSDFAILLPQTSGMDAYEEALRRQGIPFHVQSKTGFYATDAVQATAAALVAIDNPADALAVASTLRSVLFGFSDDDLLRLVLGGHDLDYRKVGSGERVAAGAAEMEEALALLRALHEARFEVPPEDLLDRLYRGTGIFEASVSDLAGRQRIANLVRLVEVARGYSSLRGPSLKGFAHWLRQCIEKGERAADAPFSEAGEGGVRLLTVHGSKGLEFPIAIVVNMASRSTGGTSLVVDRRARRVEWQVGDFRTRGFDALREAHEKPREEAEARRLLYVACTRAQDRVVLPVFGVRKKGGLEATGWLSCLAGLPLEKEEGGWHEAMPIAPGAVAPSQAQDEVDVDAVVAGDDLDTWRRERLRVWREAGEGPRILHPSTVHATSPARHAARPESPSGEVPGALLGRAVHAVLDLLDLRHPVGVRALATLQAALAGHPEASDEVTSLVFKALRTPVLQDARKARRVHAEMPFCTWSEDGAADGIREGRLDLLYEDAQGRLVLVDYKTDQVAGDAEIEQAMVQYGPQLRHYAHAVRQALGRPVHRAVLLFVRSGLERDLPLVDEPG